MGVAWSKSKQVRGHRQAALTQQRMRSDPPLFCVLLILITEVTSFFEKKNSFLTTALNVIMYSSMNEKK